VEWIPVAAEKEARYAVQHGEPDERVLVRRGNLAYAAALALLMAGDDRRRDWFRRAALDWRASFDAGVAPDAWGRPIGALKAALLARDDASVDELAHWTLGLEPAAAASPVGLYAATLALLALGRTNDAGDVAASLAGRADFPDDVAAALAALAGRDEDEYARAVGSVVASFESRERFLEDVPVADTALALHELARRLGIARRLPASRVLPTWDRPARSSDGSRS
jgi:hypothetical protein